MASVLNTRILAMRIQKKFISIAVIYNLMIGVLSIAYHAKLRIAVTV